MLKTIIIEDEKPAARRLDRMLQKNGIKALVMLHSVAESVSWLQNNPNPELIFLDVQLSDGLSFEIFEQVSVESAIIFTTAYDAYALKAFKLNSVDYLLKPIDADELSSAIQQFKTLQKQHTDYTTDFDKIKALLGEQKQNYKLRFTTQVGQHLKMIETKIITCFYSVESTTYTYVDTGKSYLLENSLDQIFEQLDPNKFYRVNRKFIINIEAIVDIISYSNSRLQLKLTAFNEKEIIVSREKVKDFKKWLTKA